MKRKRVAIAAVLIAAVLAALYLPRLVWNPAYQIRQSDTVLSAEQMRADIGQLERLISAVHPAARNTLPAELEARVQQAYEAAEAPMTIRDFYFVLSPVVCALGDAHTTLALSQPDKALDLPLRWIDGEFVCVKQTGLLECGDILVEVGGRAIDACGAQIKKTIPAENVYWQNALAAHYIRMESYLGYLGVVENGAVDVTVNRNGVGRHIRLPLEEPGDTQPEPTVSYDLFEAENVGLIRINQCVYDGDYRHALQEAFEKFDEAGVERLILDVRKNTGGNSGCINEFMSYLDVERYTGFSGAVRASWESWLQRGALFSRRAHPNTVHNHRKDTVFSGDIAVLTSGYTFSSGNWFAVVLKDNGLATVVGEPTGNRPTSYGDALRFQLENSGIIVHISYKAWYRPDRTEDRADSLYPDIWIPMSVSQYETGTDPAVQYLLAP